MFKSLVALTSVVGADPPRRDPTLSIQQDLETEIHAARFEWLPQFRIPDKLLLVSGDPNIDGVYVFHGAWRGRYALWMKDALPFPHYIYVGECDHWMISKYIDGQCQGAIKSNRSLEFSFPPLAGPRPDPERIVEYVLRGCDHSPLCHEAQEGDEHFQWVLDDHENGLIPLPQIRVYECAPDDPACDTEGHIRFLDDANHPYAHWHLVMQNAAHLLAPNMASHEHWKQRLQDRMYTRFRMYSRDGAQGDLVGSQCHWCDIIGSCLLGSSSVIDSDPEALVEIVDRLHTALTTATWRDIVLHGWGEPLFGMLADVPWEELLENVGVTPGNGLDYCTNKIERHQEEYPDLTVHQIYDILFEKGPFQVNIKEFEAEYREVDIPLAWYDCTQGAHLANLFLTMSLQHLDPKFDYPVNVNEKNHFKGDKYAQGESFIRQAWAELSFAQDILAQQVHRHIPSPYRIWPLLRAFSNQMVWLRQSNYLVQPLPKEPARWQGGPFPFTGVENSYKEGIARPIVLSARVNFVEPGQKLPGHYELVILLTGQFGSTPEEAAAIHNLDCKRVVDTRGYASAFNFRMSMPPSIATQSWRIHFPNASQPVLAQASSYKDHDRVMYLDAATHWMTESFDSNLNLFLQS